MPSPNDGSATDLPHDDRASGGRYPPGGWDPVASVWRAWKVFADRSLVILFAKGVTVNEQQVTVGRFTTNLIGANASRKLCIITNLGPEMIYLKPAAGTANTQVDYPLPPGAEFEDKYTTTGWWAATNATFADVRVRVVTT